MCLMVGKADMNDGSQSELGEVRESVDVMKI